MSTLDEKEIVYVLESVKAKSFRLHLIKFKIINIKLIINN